MSDSIREQFISAFGTRLTSLLIANQYSSDMGAEVLRGHLPPLNSSLVPCVGFHLDDEQNTALYSRKDDRVLSIRVQGVAKFGDVLPAIMAERLYADVIECILAEELTLNFNSGSTEISVADRVTGADSAATGFVISVAVNSGTWGAGNASGVLKLRRFTGQFVDNENINVGVSTNVATVDGAPTGETPCDLAGGGVVDAITFSTGSVIVAEIDDLTVSANIVFQARYQVIAGNPYSQT
jgi:hypothetical protein